MLLKHFQFLGSRGTAAGGPPPFIPFGQKIQNVQSTEKGFKSLQSQQKENENDDSEFKAQRQDAIAEANKSGPKKTFGGGSKVLIDSNLQKVMDKGYTEEQAATALKYSRNSVEKALSNLKRREEHQRRANSNEYEPREHYSEKRGGKGSSEEPHGAKPSGVVSLFDFLENKIPNADSAGKQLPYDPYEQRFENNISSSFRKDNKDFPSKPYWSQGSFADQKSSHRSSNTRDNRDGAREQRQPRDFRNNRDYKDSRGSDYKDSRGGDYKDYKDSRGGDYKDYKDSRGNDSRKDSKFQQPSSYPQKTGSNDSYQYHKSLSAIDHGSNNRSFGSSGRGRYEKTDYNNKFGSDFKKDYNKDFSNSFPPPSMGSNSNYSKPRNSNPSGPSKYYSEQQSNDYGKSSRNVVESMEKMSLKNSHQPQHYKGAADAKLNASNYPPLTSSAEPTKTKAMPPKPGYPIVGFQNKEANERAKDVLKTKSMPAANKQLTSSKPQSSCWQQKSSGPQQHSMPVSVISQQTIKTQPPPPFSNVTPSVQSHMHPPFVQHPSQPVIHAMPGAAVIPANTSQVYQTINYSAPIIMQTVAPPPGMGPPGSSIQALKIGDLCLAKYWEDGQVSRIFS